MNHLIAQLENAIAILDWKTNQECDLVQRLNVHSAPVTQLMFSPDGTYLFSTSLDGTAILWDTKTWKPLRTLTGHEGEIRAAGFSPDGKSIVTGGADKTIRIWDIDYKDTVRQVCSVLLNLGRDFTDEERTKYGITGENPTCNK